MTKKQAIEVLLDGSLYETQQVALDLAIKALEQQPSNEDVQRVVDYLLKPIGKKPTSDDCVSRQGMLNAITEIDNNVNMDIYTNEVREIIKDLPPVTPTQSWIPISERLPTKEEYITNNGLFIVSDGNRTYAEYFDIYNSMKYFGEPTINGFRVDRCVIAWQPLPQPYEEKRGDEV